MSEFVIDFTATLTARVQADSVENARCEVSGWNATEPASLPLSEITAHSVAVAMQDGEATDQSLLGDFEFAVQDACRRAYLDSNDDEIQALQDVMQEACYLLGVDLGRVREAAQKWADEN